MTNIARHAAAKQVGILLQCTASTVKLIVEDDGCGFDVERVLNGGGKTKGLGLLGIRERSSFVNGTLTIESSRGNGTTIYVEAPTETASE